MQLETALLILFQKLVYLCLELIHFDVQFPVLEFKLFADLVCFFLSSLHLHHFFPDITVLLLIDLKIVPYQLFWVISINII
jgi:hypothetical protein